MATLLCFLDKRAIRNLVGAWRIRRLPSPTRQGVAAADPEMHASKFGSSIEN